MILLFLTLLFAQANAHGSGADLRVCDTMIPGHGVDPKTTPSPYEVRLGKTTVSGGEAINITIRSKSGENVQFKGFLLQVRKPNDDTKTYGQFNEYSRGGLARTLDCFDLPKSAMTHTSGVLKKNVTVYWVAPVDEEDHEYLVFFSVVGIDGSIFWTHQQHPENILVKGAAHQEQDLLLQWREMYQGCGTTKGCFGMPGKCIEEFDPNSEHPKTCEIMVTWAKKGELNEFEITGRPNSSSKGYVAVGFSKDQKMGDDSVLGCGFNGVGAKLLAQRYHNDGYSNKKYSNATLGITQTFSSIIDGNLFCKFNQDNHKIGDHDFNFDSSKFYFLLSKAASIEDNGLGKHGKTDKGVSDQPAHITKKIILVQLSAAETPKTSPRPKTSLSTENSGKLGLIVFLCFLSFRFNLTYQIRH